VQNNAGTVDPSTFLLHFRINTGAWQTQSIPFDSGRFRPIRPFTCGESVQWYVSVRDTNGNLTTFPREGQAAPRTTVIGTALEFVSEDTFEVNNGWTVANTSLTAGAWERADPNGSVLDGRQANPENDSTDPGAQCFFTGQAAAGAAVGTADVDGGPTQLTSPVLNMSTGNHTIEYRRWFFNDDGDDRMTVELSNNGGSSWVPVEVVAPTSTSNSWVLVKISVANYLTPTANMMIRFGASDNPNNSITEAAVDDVVIRRVRTN
jgi:hypothetical protein